jgi:hypothetical protein
MEKPSRNDRKFPEWDLANHSPTKYEKGDFKPAKVG